MNQAYSFTLNAWSSSRRINLIIPRERKIGSVQNWRKERVQENRMKTLQDMEELAKVCCTEAERALQWRIDELSRQGQGKSIYSESAYGSNTGITRQVSERFHGTL